MTQKEFDSLYPGVRLFVKDIANGFVTKVTSENSRTVYIKWDNIPLEIKYTLPPLADYELQYPNNSVGLEEFI